MNSASGVSGSMMAAAAVHAAAELPGPATWDSRIEAALQALAVGLSSVSVRRPPDVECGDPEIQAALDRATHRVELSGGLLNLANYHYRCLTEKESMLRQQILLGVADEATQAQHTYVCAELRLAADEFDAREADVETAKREMQAATSASRLYFERQWSQSGTCLPSADQWPIEPLSLPEIGSIVSAVRLLTDPDTGDIDLAAMHDELIAIDMSAIAALVDCQDILQLLEIYAASLRSDEPVGV